MTPRRWPRERISTTFVTPLMKTWLESMCGCGPTVGCIVALVLLCDTIAQSHNTSTEYLPSSAGPELTKRDNWLRTGLKTVLQYAGGRFFPMRTSAGVRFILCTRRGKERVEMSQSSIEASGFDSSYPTTVLVHGYYNKVVGQSPWLEKVAGALLNKGPWNVIVVDWSRLCSVFYASTVVRARSIPGPVTADLLRMLQYVKGLDLSTVHVVGFSLGAHVAGFVGQNIKGIGRITGLDPAGPKFRAANPSKRLSPDDALFVDVVSTNVGSFIAGLSLGMNPDVDVGHVSVNFNGGEHQPGCWVGSSCSHYRAPMYFIESLQLANNFMVYPCEGSNKTLPLPFGLHMPHTARGCYFATANRNEPYLQTPSPLPLQHMTTGSSDRFEDDAAPNNPRAGDQSRHLEQDYLGQVPLLGFPDSEVLVEDEQDQEPELLLEPEQLLNSEQVLESEQLLNSEQVLESEQLLNPEKVLETEQFLEPYYVLGPQNVLEPAKLMNMKHFFELGQRLKLRQILPLEQVLEPRNDLEPDQQSEPKLFIDPEHTFNLDTFPNLKKILLSVQSGTQNQVWDSDHTFKSFKSSESQDSIHSTISVPSMVEVKPVQSVPSQAPDTSREALHYMGSAEAQNFVPIIKPVKSNKLPPLSQPQPKPVKMPRILSPQKPLESSETVRRQQAAVGQTVHSKPKPITMHDILAPRTKSMPLKSFEDYEAKLAYEGVLAQF